MNNTTFDTIYLGFGTIESGRLHGKSFHAVTHTDFSKRDRSREKNSAWLQKFFCNKMKFTKQMDIDFI